MLVPSLSSGRSLTYSRKQAGQSLGGNEVFNFGYKLKQGGLGAFMQIYDPSKKKRLSNLEI